MFEGRTIEVNTYENAGEMGRAVADSIANDSKIHFVRVTFGMYYFLIVQSYKDNTYRSVLTLSYAVNKPMFQVKKSGTWVIQE